MTSVSLDYTPAGVPVRDDLQQTQRELLEAIARPGSWLSGAERVAVAAESRNGADCNLCAERKRSLSPEQPRGEHARKSDLPEPLVELAHRVRGDPQRLSRSWFERTLAAGVSEGAYVEAVGIVAFTAGIDSFCRAIGLPAFALPEPAPGEPDRRVPEGLSDQGAWVAMLAPEDARGPEADLYASAGIVPNIARALSQVPDLARLLQSETRTHYIDLGDLQNPGVGRDLDRRQIELVAARVSAMNECFY
ncbi:MAG: hypothetical protein HKP30_04400 [Myxococcales bacterium]|nr:hypothetical protein [Myxococcales bacterium]